MPSTAHKLMTTRTCTSSSSSAPHPPRSCPCQSVTSHHGGIGSGSNCGSGAPYSYPNDGHVIGGDGNKVYCHQCVQKLLSSKIQAHREALEERNRKRAWCASQLTQMRMGMRIHNHDDNNHNNDNDSDHNKSPRPSQTVEVEQYQDRIAHLTQTLNHTMNECGSKSVALATISVQTSVRAAALEEQKAIIERAKINLDALSEVLITGMSRSGGATNQTANKKDGGGNGDNDNDENKSSQNERKQTVTEEQKTQKEQDQEQQEKLQNSCLAMEDQVGMGSLSATIHMHVDAVKRARFQLALQAFDMHKMDVGTEYQSLTLQDLSGSSSSAAASSSTGQGQSNKTTTSTSSSGNARFQRLVNERVPSGIGKIFGLLLPHRGPSHFNGVLPTNILASSLRLVASLVNILARCLSIELPHPIVLRASISNGGGTGSGIGGTRGGGGGNNTRGGTAGTVYSARSRTRTHALKRITNQPSYRNIERDDACWVEQAADIVQSVTSCANDVEEEIGGPKSLPNDERHNLTLMKDLDELDLGRDGGGNGNGNEGDNDDVIVSAAGDADANERNTSGKNMHEHVHPHPVNIHHDHTKQVQGGEQTHHHNHLASSTSSVLSLMGSNLLKSTALKAFGKMTQKVSAYHDYGTTSSARGSAAGTAAAATNISLRSLPVDDVSISERLKHASYAVLFESNIRSSPRSNTGGNASTDNTKSRNGRYILKPPSSSSRSSDREMKQKEEEHFTIGLQLLQNDIIALCIKAGVPINMLWPAEAMLLNLNSLKLYCQSQIE